VPHSDVSAPAELASDARYCGSPVGLHGFPQLCDATGRCDRYDRFFPDITKINTYHVAHFFLIAFDSGGVESRFDDDSQDILFRAKRLKTLKKIDKDSISTSSRTR
jgi:hypothetical protein